MSLIAPEMSSNFPGFPQILYMCPTNFRPKLEAGRRQCNLLSAPRNTVTAVFAFMAAGRWRMRGLDKSLGEAFFIGTRKPVSTFCICSSCLFL